MEYIVPLFLNKEDAEKIPSVSISSFHWEKSGYSRPESHAAMFAVENEGIYARMWSFEDNIRCECTKRDDPVYTDSCLELFLMPVEGDSRYINFEMNKNGVYLSQIGEKRENRVFIKEITPLKPVITPFELTENGKTAWGCEIFLPDCFIADVYKTDYSTKEGKIKGNFYKCADSSIAPHYGAFFPVTTLPPGFHNPDCFGSITLRLME
ncbi:MAG: carbohydrate-binding family 9-like protein [Clostridia bacterium]|nr:carbohydrate-binding family 9-like protein [Clostridia bacterium]